jgi:hypothetical protein
MPLPEAPEEVAVKVEVAEETTTVEVRRSKVEVAVEVAALVRAVRW